MHWLSSLAPQVQPATLKSYLTHVKSMHIEADLDFSACESPSFNVLLEASNDTTGRRAVNPNNLLLFRFSLNF